MFWRRGRKPSDANARSGGADDTGDDLAKLQKQFGIKTVSDKDVEADFLKLLGGASDGGAAHTSAFGLSPRTEQALFGGSSGGEGGGGDSDEEAAILRQLNLGGNLDAIDVDALSGDEEENDDDDGHVAKRELRGVLSEVHRTAQANASRQDASSVVAQQRQVHVTTTTTSSSNGLREKIHAMKLQAVALKREGNVSEALAVFREVKTLEAQLASGSGATAAPAVVMTAKTTTASSRSSGAPRPQPTPMATSALSDHEDDKDVDVTDEDMENPEFLAQLAAIGIPVPTKPAPTPTPVQPVETIESLERAIRASKERAVQLKRSDRIADALAEMRKVKELEGQLAELVHETAQLAAATGAPAAGSTAPVPTVSTDANLAGDSDVEVTDEDLDDPAFAAELQKMGFDPSTMDDDADKGEEKRKEKYGTASELVLPVDSSLPTTTVMPKVPHYMKRYSAVNDDDLIDEFEDSDEEDEEKKHNEPTLEADSEAIQENADRDEEPPAMVAVSAASAAAVSEDLKSLPQPSNGASENDLLVQLEKTKLSAVQLKRQGNVQAALDMMRRIKQIENLIEMKRRQAPAVPRPPTVPPSSPEELERIRKFGELEALLVRYANDATQRAKNQLSLDRAKAAEWLARRKAYSGHLVMLREKRQVAGQDPPSFRIQQISEQIKVEMTDVPHDEVHLRIASVNELKQAAGKDVFVKFNLSFPSNDPHEGKTGSIRISSAVPFESGSIKSENMFRLNVQRGRGTQRLFEIKKAVFEVWRPGSLLRNPELIARGYQELALLLTVCEVNCRVPFVGSNRKPVGGDVEISLRLRTPLREKQFKTLVTEVVQVGEYPPPQVRLPPPSPSRSEPSVSRPHARSDMGSRVEHDSDEEKQQVPLVHARSAPVMPTSDASSATATSVDLDDPHDLDLIISYDVINDEITRIEAALPALEGDVATEFSDRLDSLGFKKQLLEIDMQTGKLTLDMYVVRLKQRILDDRAIIKRLMKSGRKPDAVRVLHRVKLMEKELEGAEGTGEAEAEDGI